MEIDGEKSMRVGWLCRCCRDADSLYGGKAYERRLLAFVRDNYTIESLYPYSDHVNEMWRWAKELYTLSNLASDNDVFIRDFYSSAVMGETCGRNVSIIHHIDSSQMNHPFLNRLLEKKFYRNLNKIDTVVVVSEFWKKHFEDLGHEDVRVIHNAFDLRVFDRSDEAVHSFREKYNLIGKPIIYLGNCQTGKGVVEAYRELKHRDAFFVTSGEEGVKIPALNLNLDYGEYLTLLTASSVVVAMSKFKEGWNRTVHEAMLCKTPVIGSGLGGMYELLEGGRQVVCKDIARFDYLVDCMIGSPWYGQYGHKFAKDFTGERFVKAWRMVLEEV